MSGFFFFFLKLDVCTESFLSSSLGKHLLLTFVRVTDVHQDKAAVHPYLPVSKRTILSTQTYPQAGKCENGILEAEALSLGFLNLPQFSCYSHAIVSTAIFKKQTNKQTKRNKKETNQQTIHLTFCLIVYPKRLILLIFHHCFKNTITTARTIS